MKNRSFLNLSAGLGIALSIGLLSFKSSESIDAKININKPTGMQASYHYDSVKVISNYKFNPAASASSPAYVRVLYPVFQDQKLNNIIKSEVLAPIKLNYEFKNMLAAQHPALSNLTAINNGAEDYREMANNFIQQFEAQAAGEDLEAYWYADINVRVLAENHDYTTLLCEKDYFTGGLHDLYEHIYLNYDNRNHRLISLASQLKPGQQDQLKVIAERIFRKNEGLTPAQQLDGYFFKNGKFDLPANFTITNKGLLFYYDYYEIKPFAAGTTQMMIPFAQFKNLVLPGSILARQMNMN